MMTGQPERRLEQTGGVARAFPTLAKIALTSAAGTLVGGIVAVLFVAVENALAADGPNFPPALVAPFIVLPVTIALLPLQLLAGFRYRPSRPMPLSRGMRSPRPEPSLVRRFSGSCFPCQLPCLDSHPSWRS